MSTARWIIASNRLPYHFDEGSQSFRQSSGGLVSAIMGIHENTKKCWVGSVSESEWSQWQAAPPPVSDDALRCEPIVIEAEDYDAYYNGFCNDVLWPLFHYQSERVQFRHQDWLCYQTVNRMFAERIAQMAQPDDLIWVHDFQLCLVPQYLRELKPDLRIGWFLHIPFPSSEMYLELSVRHEILQGILSADLVGFQDYGYLQHFCRAVQRSFGIETTFAAIEYENRQIALGVFPVSIDYPIFHHPNKSRQLTQLTREYQVSEIVCLGVDRLDYTKGIDLKIRAFATLLQRHPELHEKVCLIQVAVPTRENVEEYMRLRVKVERLVGEVNGQYATPAWTPIHYLYHSVTFEELISLYRSSHYLLVTSKRDGMNLVALEYVAAQQPENPGVVLISEFAGAKSLLSEAIPINPNDVEGTAGKLFDAIQMSHSEKQHACEMMQHYLSRYTATDWSCHFIRKLKQLDLTVADHRTVLLQEPKQFLQDFWGGQAIAKRVIFLDYDGTLVEICRDPQQATLTPEDKSLLKKFEPLSGLQIVLISGRDQHFLSEQFLGCDIQMAAEHGALFFDGKKWQSLDESGSERWYDNALQIMTHYASQTPGSFIEKKKSCLVWHYRRSPVEFAQYQSLKLYEELEHGLSQFPVRLMRGKKVIEVGSLQANKGAFVRWYLQQHPEFTHGLALGDDVTDEDMFIALKDSAFATIKVGLGKTAAHYRLAKQAEVLPLLSALSVC